MRAGGKDGSMWSSTLCEAMDEEHGEDPSGVWINVTVRPIRLRKFVVASASNKWT